VVTALVVHAHPVEGSFVSAVRDRVLTGLRAGGHSFELLDLCAERFEARLSAAEHAGHRAPVATKPHLAPYVEQLRRCDTVILVYPTWWGGLPAILKGWLDRVWVNEVAWTLPDGGGPPRPLLRNVRRIVAVTTHGSSKWINAVEGEGGKRTVKRAMRASCGWRCRTSWIAMYTVDRSSEADRRRFLDRVERRIQRLR
jgi:putative NADPH-quinone reductase